MANLQKSRLGPEGAGGPDASKVWNKNRPAPTPTPRALTDEELKQQYGIHLATRLQSEEDGKESKWADIDDDEDDWAPDAVVWMDGTKSTVTPQDAVPPQKDEQDDKPPVPPAPKPVEGMRPILALKQRSDIKILKPGIAVAQAKSSGPAAPSPSPDKASLKTKSPAPAPTKSPWAAMPKVDSISPINPPVQQPQALPKLATQDARAYEMPQAPPAREIAADTFDRSWKEGEGGTRELFNSTNGRYEPAPEGRRGSVKPDASHRKPAVLQRPSQLATSPAEPSAAFQSRTATQMDGSWGRRRGSSVSQGSMPSVRRMSMNQRPDLAQMPEVPQALQPPANSRSANVRPSFSQQSAWDQQLPPRPEPGLESAPPAPAPGPAEPAVPAEDPLKVQERVMRESREQARKRRIEEEKQAEVEKQERLKAKLAQLEGAGKSKKEREAEAAAAAASSKEESTSIVKQTGDAALSSSHASQPEATDLESSSAAGTAAEAQPLPLPLPAARAQTEPSPFENRPSPLPPKPQPQPTPADRPLSNEPLQRQVPQHHLSPRAGGRAPYQPPPASAPHNSKCTVPNNNKGTGPSSYSPSSADRKLQPLNSTFDRSSHLPSDTFTPWQLPAPSRSVWGTAGIGNGTFDSNSSFAPVPMSQQNSALPPPPGMGRSSTSARISPQGFSQGSHSPSLPQPSLSDHSLSLRPSSTIEPRSDSFASNPARINRMSPAPAAGRLPHPPGPIGPPSRTGQPGQQQAPPPGSRAPPREPPVPSWHNAHYALSSQFAANIAAGNAVRKQREAAHEFRTMDHPFKETFKKTTGKPGRYESTEITVYEKGTAQSMSSETQPQAPVPSATPVEAASKPAAESTVRIPDPSGNLAHSGAPVGKPYPVAPHILKARLIHENSVKTVTESVPTVAEPVEKPYLNLPHMRKARYIDDNSVKTVVAPVPPVTESKEQPPLSPETDGSPVNQGNDAGRPQVRLPPPQAKVRLPPASPTSIVSTPALYHAPVVMPPRQPTWNPGAARPLVQSEDWQARFNGLFNRAPIQTETPPSPPKTPPKMQGPALAIASSSRTVMHESASDATVSLPVAKSTIESSILSDTKPSLDEMFKEELRFGSMPKVQIPSNTAHNTEPYTDAQIKALQYSNSQLNKRLETQSGQDPFFWKSPHGYFVAIRGTPLRNKLCRKAGAPDHTSKEGERKFSQARQGGNDWNLRAGQTQTGARYKDWYVPKSSQAQTVGKETQDRKHSSKFSKAKSGKDTDSSPSAAPTPANGEAAKKSNYQKPSRPSATAALDSSDTKPTTADVPKSETAGGDKKNFKSGGRKKSPHDYRKDRNSATAAAATSTVTATAATPAKFD